MPSPAELETEFAALVEQRQRWNDSEWIKENPGAYRRYRLIREADFAPVALDLARALRGTCSHVGDFCPGCEAAGSVTGQALADWATLLAEMLLAEIARAR